MNNDFKDKLTNLEKTKTFSELDFKITANEILHSIAKLKAGKSSGLDGIKNEMLKCGQSSLLPPYGKTL